MCQFVGHRRDSCRGRYLDEVVVARGGIASSSALPVRATDDAAEVAAVEVRLLVGDHVGLNVAEGSVRLVLDAVIERLDDVFLELSRAWESTNDGLAFCV